MSRINLISEFNNYEMILKNLNMVIEKFTGKIRVNCIIFDENYKEEDYNEIVEFCKVRNLGLRLVEPSIVDGLEITYKKEKFKEYIEKIRNKADKVILSDCKSVEYIFFKDWYLTVMHSLCDNKLCDSCINYMYIRVTSERKLKPCLSRRDTEVYIDTSDNNKIREAFIEAITHIGEGIK